MFKNHSSMVVTHIVIGLIFSLIYYFSFKFFIQKFNIKTVGREPVSGNEEIIEATIDAIEDRGELNSNNSDFSKRAEFILAAFGGKENIASVNNCATRLRIEVFDEKMVAGDDEFKKANAFGVVRKKKSFQIIIGMEVSNICDAFEKLL